MQGYNYLRRLIEPVVATLVNHGQEQSVEIDATKAAPDVNIRVNTQNLQAIAQELIDNICVSADTLPAYVVIEYHEYWY